MRITSTLLICSVVAWASENTLAQRALGDGRALDNNLQEGSGGRNARAHNLQQEFMLRNAIVTGRAAGGMSFRGDVGYGAPDDFRGELAEDDLFAFDRDSFYSGLSGQGVRGADALQLQMQLTVGGFVGDGDFLPQLTTVQRYQDATSASGLMNAQRLQSEFGGADPLEFREGSLRATSAYLAGLSEAPVLLKVTEGEPDNQQAPSYDIASPLRSLTTQPTPQPERRLSDAVRNLEAIENRLENPSIDERLPSNQVTPENSVHRSIIERQLEQQAESTEPAVEPHGAPVDGEAPQGDAAVTESDLLARLRELREDLMRPKAETPEYGGSQEEDPDATEALRQRIADDAKKLFEGPSIHVDSIAPPAEELSSIFAEHMRGGQAMLSEGQWFSAEERFTSALGLRPGDPMAAVGRVHAQIGGGMFLSAGLNLQKLFRAHPELMNVKYGPELLPEGERLLEVEAMLLTRLRGEDDFSRGAAIVQAYLGFQTGNAAWTTRGLDRALEIDAALGRPKDSLLSVLRQAWSAE